MEAQPSDPVATLAMDDGPSVQEEQANRPREEMNMLLMGFGTGISIGVFFLIYIVLSLTSLA